MPFSAYADSQYDPEKDGELGADDARLTAMEVICDDLDMTTLCNPAAGVWPTRCEEVIEDPAKMFALKEMSLNTYRSVAYKPQIEAAARKEARRCALGTCWDLPRYARYAPRFDAHALLRCDGALGRGCGGRHLA